MNKPVCADAPHVMRYVPDQQIFVDPILRDGHNYSAWAIVSQRDEYGCVIAILHHDGASIPEKDMAHIQQCFRFGQAIPCAIVSISLIHISEPTRLGMISYAVF